MGTSEARGSLPSGGGNFPRATALFLLFTASTYLCAPLYHPYHYWDVVLGHWVAAHRGVPTTNLWTWVGLNQRWVSDSWLYSLIVGQLEPWGEGIAAFGMLLLSFFCLCCIWWLFIRQARSLTVGTGITFLVAPPIFWGGVVRAEHVGLALGALLIGETYSVIANPSPRALSCRILYFVLAVALVNFSGMFLFFIPLCVALLAQAVVLGKQKRLYLFALSVSPFCSPYGGFQVWSLLSQGAHLLQNNLLGLFAPNIFYFPFAFLLIMLLLVAVLWHEVPAAIGRVEIFALVVATIAALSSALFIPISVFISGLLVARLWGHGASESQANIVEAVRRLEQILMKLPRLGIIWIALCLTIVNLYQFSKNPLDNSALPVKAVDFILDQNLTGAIAHEPILGSYLIYRFSNGAGEPYRVVAADDRGMSLSNDFILAYRAFHDGGRFWAQFVKAYAPQVVLCRSIDPVYFLLRSDEAWELVFGELSESEMRGLGAGGSWVVFRRLAS